MGRASAPRGGDRRRRSARDRGAVSAEVAVALPTVVVVLVACLGGIGAAVALGRAHDAAADAARLVARGDPVERARGHVASAAPGASLTISRSGDLVCAVVNVTPTVLGMPIPLSARSCALAPSATESPVRALEVRTA
ncbi:TadE family type IV pilus minor pilin [Microcella alkalica]|uniref:TadE family type IV pilus minor pilin n=1 Tax=Microcella alkalica TaxID=355930 RepID=UPI00145CD74A